jgi:hypothetical protein
MCSVLYTASLQRLTKHFSNNFESLKDCILLINSMLLLSIQPKLSLQYKIINSANIKKN